MIALLSSHLRLKLVLVWVFFLLYQFSHILVVNRLNLPACLILGFKMELHVVGLSSLNTEVECDMSVGSCKAVGGLPRMALGPGKTCSLLEQ